MFQKLTRCTFLSLLSPSYVTQGKKKEQYISVRFVDQTFKQNALKSNCQGRIYKHELIFKSQKIYNFENIYIFLISLKSLETWIKL